MRFKIGDTVKIRKDLICGQEYDNGVSFITNMKKFAGNTVRIARYVKNTGKYIGYQVDTFPENEFTWTDSMFEPVQEEYKIIVNGRAVIAIEGEHKGIAKCSPEDEFDLATGISLAISRLKDKKEEKCWKPKINEKYWTIKTGYRGIQTYTWYDDHLDKCLLHQGFVCKTKEDAEKLMNIILTAAKEFQKNKNLKEG